MQLFIGFTAAVLISLLAWKTQNLSTSGALAATVLGTIVFGLGGLPWAVLLLGFFITSSALSKLLGQRKAALDASFSKGSRRDWAQVLANGGLSGLFVLLHLLQPQAAWPWLGFAGTLAAANADTWATELGVLSRAQPYLITSLRPVERGTAGAVTLPGTLAALAGGLLIGALAVLVGPSAASSLAVVALIGLAGLLGSLIDSLLAASLQAIYICPACGKETERHPLHSCGAPTQFKRGWPWLNNDWVNSLCTLAGGAAALLGGLVLI